MVVLGLVYFLPFRRSKLVADHLIFAEYVRGRPKDICMSLRSIVRHLCITLLPQNLQHGTFAPEYYGAVAVNCSLAKHAE